jgi:hypothetical protein
VLWKFHYIISGNQFIVHIMVISFMEEILSPISKAPSCGSVLVNFSSGKGKAVPLQARCDPNVSRKLRFPDFLTTAQDGGKVVSLTHRPHLPPEIHVILISVRG